MLPLLYLFLNANTSRFSGAQHHHYLLDFLKRVANRYCDDGRAGDFVMDLLKLKVPKLFAVEQGGEKDEEVRCMFTTFLRNYIHRNALKHTILKNMSKIMVRQAVLFKHTTKHTLGQKLSHHKARNAMLSTPSIPFTLPPLGCNLRPR